MTRVDKNAARRRRHSAWLASCAMASALALAPHAARAQAFQGTPTTVYGTVSYTDGSNTTTIASAGSEAVINWAPSDVAGSGTIDFLPAGNTANFTGVGTFTVLNRILPVDAKGNPTARDVAFNGTINGTSFRGGNANLWFYTPTGLIIGPTATINAGGIILTTDDILYDPKQTGGTELYGPAGQIMFRGGAGSTGLVDVQTGAQLTAIGPASYIAMVSPRIQQGGTVSADRSIAYVAAEQADLTINAGMFDISILAGTTDSNGIVHTGTTTGSASTSGFDAKTISFVALPKATALTMLLSGAIGYAPALDATNDGSAVVLTSGFTTAQPTAEAAGSLGNISIDDASFNNPVAAFASGKLVITAAGGPVSFAGYANLFAQDAIDITLGAGEQLTSASSLFLSTARDAKGGAIDISLGRKALFSVAGTLDVYASNSFAPFFLPSPAVARGGSVTIDANGGTLSAGDLYTDADAYAGYDAAIAAPAIGGTIALTARNGGSVTANSFDANVDAFAGYNDTGGGDATGGSIALTSQNGALNLGAVTLEAEAYGAQASGNSGAATGGKAAISLSGGTYNWDSLSSYASAFAGEQAGSQGNSATAPSDAFTLSLANSAALNVTNDIYVDASALASVDGIAGTSARGGGMTFDVGAGSTLTFGNLFAYAEAGVNLSFGERGAPIITPDVTGGTIKFTTAGQVTGSSIHLLTDGAEFGASSAAGTARGGKVDMLVDNGGNVALDDGAGTATLELDASGLGAVGASAANAIGGSATLSVADGTVNVNGTVNVSARGQWHENSIFFASGPDPHTGFNAQGGLATVALLPGTSGTASLTTGSLVVDATGDASTPAFNYTLIVDGGPAPGTYGGPMAANGGDGTGGTATLNVAAGTLDLSSGGALIEAGGQGGISSGSTLGTAFQSGNGFGGTATVGATGGTSTLGYLQVAASGVGGGGSVAGGVGELPALAGNGTGGNALVSFSGGSFSPASLILEATGTGGTGGGSDADQAGTNGGKGSGGTAQLSSPSGAIGTLTSSNVLLLAGGAGGAGGFGTTDGNGGDGIGGMAATNLADGAFDIGVLILGADGDGGNGAAGGRGTGGSSNFKLVDSSGPAGARTLGLLQLYGNGIGGTGATGAAGPSDAGATGLDVEAFDSTSGLGITGDLFVDAEGANAPAGEGFVALIGGAPLTVGGNTTVTTPRDVTIGTFTPIQTTGNVDITGRTVISTGLFSAGGNVNITGDQGIALKDLSSGGTTSLLAPNGSLVVTHDLESAGDVTASGQIVGIDSLGPLSFAQAQATAGSLTVLTHGDLAVAGASATDSLTLITQIGSLTASAPLVGGGYVSLSGATGLTAGSVSSGATTDLSATNGAISIGALNSPGAITASARAIDIASTDALLFDTANATAGHLNLTGLSLSASGPLSASGNVNLNGPGGITLTSLTSGGTTSLRANNGDIFVPDLQSAGLVTARARSLLINSGAGLTFDTATATAGDLTIGTTLGLTVNGAVSATGGIILSGNGGLTAGTVSSGGTTLLSAANGVVLVSDLHSPGAVGAAGQSVNIASTDALTFAGAEATAGDLSLTALQLTASGPLSATGNVAIDAANGVTVGSVTSGGTTALTSDAAISATDLDSAGPVSAIGSSLDLASSGALGFDVAKATGGDLTIATAGNLALSNASATGSVSVTSTGGKISSSGLVKSGLAFSASGAKGLDFATLNTTGATSLLANGGAVKVADLVSAGQVTARGRSIDIASSGGLNFAQATATAGDLTLSTVQGLTLAGPASAAGKVDLSGGAFLSSLGTLNSGGTTNLSSSGGNVAVTALTSRDFVTATGQSLSITSPGALSFDTATATAGDISVQATDVSAIELSAGGSVSLDGTNGVSVADKLLSGGTTHLRADNGAIAVSNLVSTDLVEAFGQSIDIASGGALSFENAVASAGDISIDILGNLSVDHVSATGNVFLAAADLHTVGDVSGADITLSANNVTADDSVTASGSLLVHANSLFSLGGTAAANSIAVSSSDIDMGVGAQLGLRGTTRDITLTNRLATGLSTIGGAAGAGGYDLDSTEAARLFADNSITLAGGGQVTIGDLKMGFGTADNIGTGGFLKVTTSGNVEVNGAVKLTTTSNDDTFSIDPVRIDVLAGQGSMAMQSASGDPQGTIDLTAGTVAVLAPATRDAISGLTDLGQISKLLDAPADAGPAGGYLQAGTIRITADNAFLVQNGGLSDAFADRRGFTANELDITTGSASTQIAINGVILQNGDPVAGLATTPLVKINGKAAAAGGQFAGLSTINGCVIGTDCAAPPPPPPPEEPPVTNPTDDDLTGPVDHPTGDGVFVSELFSLGDNAPLITPPLVDEPITGVGNDDLWISGCSDNDTDKRCSDKKEGG